MPFLKRVFSACLFLCILLVGPQGCASKLKLAVAGSFVQDVALATARHDDIDLATQAAPTYLLLLEGLLGDHPNNQTLLIATAQAYMGYGALVESENPARAGSLYRRAKTYGLRALAQKGKIAPLLDAPFTDFSRVTEQFKAGDAELVFWAASSWGAWISVNTESMRALAELPKVILLMEWVLQQDESIQYGSPHLFLGVFHAAWAFDHQHNEDFVVCPLKVLGDWSFKVQGVHPASDAAIPHRRILRHGDDGLGLFHRVNHGCNDAPSADVQCAIDIGMRSFWHATERDAAGVGD